MSMNIDSATNAEVTNAARAGTQALERLSRLGPADLHSVGTLIASSIAVSRVAWGPAAQAGAAALFAEIEQRCYVKAFPSFARPNCIDQSIAYVKALKDCEEKTTPEARLRCERDAEAENLGPLVACEMARLKALVGVRPTLPPRPPRPGPLLVALTLAGLLVIAVVEAFIILSSPGRDLLIR
jgi:hypothetical protein